MKLLNFTIIKLTTSLVLGILIAYFLAIPLTLSFYGTVLLLSILSIVFFLSKEKKTKTIWFGLLSFLTMISIGVLTTNVHDEKQQTSHYTAIDSNEKTITFRVRSTLKSGIYNDKYIVDVLKIDSLSVSGKALLNVSKNNSTKILKVDDIIIAFENFEDITGITNPHQFNYKSYLEKQYVYKQLYVNPKRIFLVSNDKHTIYGYADVIRQKINTKIERYFDPEVLSIINALILGQRQNLSKTIYDNYTDAGAVHILAVSGLHVALILLLLNFLFKPLKQLKYGRQITILLLVIIMWCFAIIAGLTASVTRAVTMFSIIAIGMHLKRPTNIYNTLSISVFILLLFKPLFLFDVGFQLSYLAVIAIVAIQPKLVKLWQPKNYLIAKIWDYFTVGIAAQFGVLPISLYYFHQFPGLFFVANVIIIPFLGIILGIGILVIVLAILNALPEWLVEIFHHIISSMNSLMKWLALQDRFLFKDISFNIFKMYAAYILIIAFIQFAIKKNFKWLRLTIIAILLLQGTYLFSKFENSKHELTIFHKSKHTIIGNKAANSLTVYTDLDSLKHFYNLNDYKVGNNIKHIKKECLTSVINLNKTEYLLIIDSLGIYMTKRFKPDFVLLTQSPKLNMMRLIDSIQPRLIIADGSNYKSYISKWKATCKKQKIPFHYTGEKGALVLTID